MQIILNNNWRISVEEAIDKHLRGCDSYVRRYWDKIWVQTYFSHQSQISNVVFLGPEDLEEDRLSFNFVLAKHNSCFLRYQAVPFLVHVRESVFLE